MTKQAFEYSARKQPNSIELYVKKIKKMNNRTLAKYESRWASFLHRNADLSLIENLELLVNSIIDDANNHKIRPATFRVYKAVLCYGLATTHIKLDNDLISDDELENGLNYQSLANLYRLIQPVNVPLDKSILFPPRTSSSKLKFFPEPFYSHLKDMSVNSDIKLTKRFKLMFDFVEANLVIGARPVEWLDIYITSNIEKKCLELFIKNAKNSFGRANGDVRELLLENANAAQELAIIKYYVSFQNYLADTLLATINNEIKAENTSISKSHIFNYIIKDFEPSLFGNIPKSDICNKYMVPQQGLAEIVLGSMQNEMFLQFNAYRKENPKEVEAYGDFRVSLYSTRHQCIANAKASKKDIYEIAGFFGHASVETASRHYGKAWNGWSNFTFKPSLESIRAVNGSDIYFANEISQEKFIEAPVPSAEQDYTLRH